MISLKGIHEVNPYNEKDLELVKKYNSNIYNEIVKSTNGMNYDNYKRKLELDVLVKKYYYTSLEDSITNLITVVIEKDTKIASLYPNFSSYNKKLIPELCDYMLNDMEEVFVFIKSDNVKVINDLLNDRFISLKTDDDGGLVPLLKEKVFEEERNLSWKY